jgi:GTP pyrophosphokinase
MTSPPLDQPREQAVATLEADPRTQWSRTFVDREFAQLVATYRNRHPGAATDLLDAAFRMANDRHRGQVRKSGEPYVSHPIAVATVLAELGLDDLTLAAALLHDVVEDTPVTLEDVRRELGAEIADIVDGVTKLDRLQFDTKEAQQAANMQKLLVAMAKDIRVLLIKLCDRLHNMRTIAALPEHKQQRTAQETLDVYAPLAHRLGIAEIKWQLQDLAFSVLHPKRYAEIEQMVATRAPEGRAYLQQVIADVRQCLADLHIDAEVNGRPKHYWSIYEKMIVKGREFDDIHDLVGIRVIVDSVKDCYGALGSIHALWSPVTGRFKDYIAMPKFNLYQSLHTTVVGPQGKAVEVQIRTKEMHQRAERGIAAHWGYKENIGHATPAGRHPGATSDMGWLQRLVDWQQESSDPGEFMEHLKLDLEQDEVYVFTPKGDVLSLPTDASAVDFAYAIHTEVGHRCIGARVNGRLVSLDSKLASGDSVEIFTSKVEGAGPSRDWLKFVVTPRARSKIRQWFSRERREDAMENGREELVKALRREGLPVQRLTGSTILSKVAQGFKYADLDALYVAIGESHVSAKAVAQRVQRELRGGEEQLPTTAQRPPRTRPGRANRRIGVHVEGLDDIMVRLSRCCTPVPGDEIIGFVTRGRGVSVHRADCANAVALSRTDGQEGRLIEVEWDAEAGGTYVASVQVEALDRARLLRDVAEVMADYHVNILGCTTTTSPDRVATLRFDFELADPGHLTTIIAAVKRVESVYEAYRIVPGKTPGA